MWQLARVVLFIIGALSGNCWSHPENSSVISSCLQSFNYDHCHLTPEGVHDLDCYRQQSEKLTRCVWKPGRRSSNKTTYSLVIEQKDRDFCDRSENISKTTHLFVSYKDHEMTAYVVDASSDETKCTMAMFNGTPKYLVRCGPPTRTTFKRNSGHLVIFWMDRPVNKFLVKYRELNGLPWKEVGCEKKKCTVDNLISSLSYEVKVQCVKDSKCHQCPWSNVTIVPPELTSTPVIEKFDVISQKMGKRLIVAHWKLGNSESVSGYRVEVGKESGEFNQTLNVTKPMLSLILSGSAYYINISAFNSAGTSPSAHRVVPAITNAQDWGLIGNLNITFRSNDTFEISWNHSLTRAYWCYSVEWGLKGEKMSFHPLHRKSSDRNVISLKASLQPYKRYVFLLHTRPDKDTCNLKSINNSESTNGRTEAYAKEGTPASSPGNITCLVSSTSLALAWKPVPEEDAYGFILGYILYYAENGKGQNSSVVIGDAGANGYTLSDLKSQTAYEVQLSAFTAAGEGVRSASFYFETANPGYKAVEGAAAGIVGGVVLLILMVNLSFVLCQRAKKVFWPNIPNPGNSNAIQKIDVAFELEVLQPLSREMLAPLEESDTSSLLIIEGIAETLPAPASHLSIPDLDEPSPASSVADLESPSPSQRREPSPTPRETAERRAAPPVAVSDYTTMELFQQTMAQPQATGPEVQAQHTMAQSLALGPGVQAQQTQQTMAQPQAPGPEVQAQQTMAQPQAPGPEVQAQQTMAQPQAPGPGVQAQQTQQTMAQPQAPGPGMQAQQTMAQPQALGPGVQAQQTQQTTAQPQAPDPGVQAQQTMAQPQAPGPVVQAVQVQLASSTLVRPEQDYIRQCMCLPIAAAATG